MADKRVAVTIEVGSDSIKLSRLISSGRPHWYTEGPTKQQLSDELADMYVKAIDAVLKEEKIDD